MNKNSRINKKLQSVYIVSTVLKNSPQFFALSWKFCIFVYTIFLLKSCFY